MSVCRTIGVYGLSILAGICPATAETYTVPSGQPVTLGDVIWDEVDGTWLRLRFLAPGIARDGASPGFETVGADLLHLCETVGLALLEHDGREVERIVVSLADREVPFGTSDAEATQYFDAFRPQAGRCIWEAF